MPAPGRWWTGPTGVPKGGVGVGQVALPGLDPSISLVPVSGVGSQLFQGHVARFRGRWSPHLRVFQAQTPAPNSS